MATNALDTYFKITENGSTIRRELVGGITTFATMSYIIFVQPTVLSIAGMDFGSVLLATCLSSAIACMFMGLFARYPFALAPGMGENFLLVFMVCSTFPGGMGFSWRAGLAIVFISGVLFMILSATTLREKVLEIMPSCLTNSIGPAIGLFIGFVGLQWGGIVTLSPTTMVKLGSFHTGPALLTITGVLLIAVLRARQIRGEILIGILVTGLLGVISGVIPLTTAPVHLSTSTFFQLDFAELTQHWSNTIIAVCLFFFLVLFDTVGTLVGVGTQAGFLQADGKLPRAGRAFFADAFATTLGALFGTSTVTSYIESASGVAAGARTGLAAIVTGLCFLASLALTPVIHLAGQDIGAAFAGVQPGALYVSMYPMVAPALIVIGFMMMTPLSRIKWDDTTESLPAFLTIAGMVFGYAIIEGIALGVISYVLIKALSRRHREVHPVLYLTAFALVCRYIFLV